jgi:hypothetical protein
MSPTCLGLVVMHSYEYPRAFIFIFFFAFIYLFCVSVHFVLEKFQKDKNILL